MNSAMCQSYIQPTNVESYNCKFCAQYVGRSATDDLLTQTATERLRFKAMPHLGWTLHEAGRCECFVLFWGERFDPEVELAAADGQACTMMSAQVSCTHMSMTC